MEFAKQTINSKELPCDIPKCSAVGGWFQKSHDRRALRDALIGILCFLGMHANRSPVDPGCSRLCPAPISGIRGFGHSN